jgi:hypothetical protein
MSDSPTALPGERRDDGKDRIDVDPVTGLSRGFFTPAVGNVHPNVGSGNAVRPAGGPTANND